MSNPPSDDRAAERVKHTFTLLPADTPLPAFNQITSVGVVPFDQDGKMVAAQLSHRGIDLAAGHTEPEDKSCEDTARRETLEEICVTVGALVPACVIQSTMMKNNQPTFMVIMTGPVKSFEALAFSEGEASRGRVSLSPQDFVAQYRGGMDPALMRGIVEQSAQVYHSHFKPS